MHSVFSEQSNNILVFNKPLSVFNLLPAVLINYFSNSANNSVSMFKTEDRVKKYDLKLTSPKV